MSRAPWTFKIAAAAIGVLVAGGLFLIARRVLRPPPLLRKCGDCAYLYEPNPARADIGPQGLRDRAYAIPKPNGRKRILVLGDSVAFGQEVEREQTFPKRLEAQLDGVDVINAGVPGYNAYTELELYLARGRAFQTDLVIVAVCLNDVIDPLVHWTGFTRDEIPKPAIPNPAHAAPAVAPADLPTVVRDGQRWPVFLTAHDDVPIQVLLDPESIEWRWLRGIYGQLADAVRADGAQLALVIFPFRYQVEREGYPFLPQEEFLRYCGRAGLTCLDLLPAMRGQQHAFHDFVHLSADGHALARAHPSLLGAAN